MNQDKAAKVARMQRRHDLQRQMVTALWGILGRAAERKKAGKRVSFDADCRLLLSTAEKACDELDRMNQESET